MTCLHLLFGTLAFYLAWKLYKYLTRPAALPPGPLCLPVVGDLSILTKQQPFYRYVDNLHRQYGDICYVKILGISHPLLLLNTYPVINEAFTKLADYFSDRPLDRINLLGTELGKSLGVASASANLAKELRRFSLLAMRGFGLGKTSLEDRAREECVYLFEAMDEQNGHQFDHAKTIQKAVSNIISSMVFGRRFDYDNQQLEQLLTDITDEFGSDFTSILDNFLPLWALKLLVKFDSKLSLDRDGRLRLFIRQQIDQHQSTFSAEHIRDFVDMYIKEFEEQDGAGQQRTDGAGQRTDGYKFTENQFITTIMDLFVAGTETTATTLQWAIVLMLNHPAVADKVRQEIDRVIGAGRLPTTNDRQWLPFTEATLLEVQRISSIAGSSLFHQVNRDLLFNGWLVPAGTVVLASIWSTHMDDRVWQDPLQFRPERFLDESADNLLKHEAWIPFSVGRRMCLGEQLAKMELFVFFTALMQNFILLPAEDGRPPSAEIVEGFTLSPKPFQFKAVRR